MSRLNQKIKTGNRKRGNDASEWRECFVSSGQFFFFFFGWKSFSARALSGGATTMNEKHANNSFFFVCFVLGGIKCVCMCVCVHSFSSPIYQVRKTSELRQIGAEEVHHM